jgi:hypothetical protein
MCKVISEAGEQAPRRASSAGLPRSWPGFVHLFRRYGPPERIRTDKGTPFASNALGRLSTLSVWWVRLGGFGPS